MTSQDHNRTLGLAHGFVGFLIFTALIVTAVLEMHKATYSNLISTLPRELFFLPLPLLQLLTAYGIFRRNRWVRILALVFSALYVWVFPLGTALAIYTCWFLQSQNGKRLYVLSMIGETLEPNDQITRVEDERR